jgi:hypothetical protein
LALETIHLQAISLSAEKREPNYPHLAFNQREVAFTFPVACQIDLPGCIAETIRRGSH